MRRIVEEPPETDHISHETALSLREKRSGWSVSGCFIGGFGEMDEDI